MARIATPPPFRLLAAAAAALLAPVPAAAQQPAFMDGPVDAVMVVAAIGICTTQLRAGAFDPEPLTGAGWVVAVRSEGAADPAIRAYRHPDNMIMLTTIDSAAGGDKCMVMAPTWTGLTFDATRSAISELTDSRPRRAGEALVWRSGGLSLLLKPMGPAGVVIEIEPRSSDADSRRR